MPRISNKNLLKLLISFFFMNAKTVVVEKNVLIGLEIHGYIETGEKLFCTCANFHDMKKVAPNTNICPICTGQPGAKPMLPNRAALDKVLQIGLLLGCKPNVIEQGKELVFQRKHYRWPDMPYGYQKTISGAHSLPVAENGLFESVRIREVHLEEDPAAWNPDTGFIDYNRAGVPLIEIVTEPDFHDASSVGEWLKNLVLTLSYIKALNKDAGIKADVNVNINGISERTEIKNVNSISEIMRAITAEIMRHQNEKPQERETRRWNSAKGKTELMRSKETAADYRFIPDPDLLPLHIPKKFTDELKKNLPESPQEKLEKIIKKHKISQKDAEVLTNNLELVEFFEEVSRKIPPSFALPWVTTELLRVLNYNKKTLEEVSISTEHFIELLQAVKDKKLTELKAKQILNTFIPSSHSISKELSSSQRITDKSEIRKICEQAIKNNKKAVDDFKAGEKKAIDFLLGEIMKLSNRRADYQIAKEELMKLLK